MVKISTLYKKNPANLALVIDEINPENEWVLQSSGWFATRKYDGTAAAIKDGEVYKRYDVKKGKLVPEGAIPCQEPDEITGHWPHWIKCDPSKKEDKYFIEGLKNLKNREDGTYELCGPKVQGNPELFDEHTLVKHGDHLIGVLDVSFNGLKQLLTTMNIEGIVFYNVDGRMCKIRKSDFGINRS